MPKLPQIPGARVVRALERVGWRRVYQEGSHVRLEHPERRGRITVLVHGSTPIKTGTLHGILKQAGLTVAEFRRLL